MARVPKVLAGLSAAVLSLASVSGAGALPANTMRWATFGVPGSGRSAGLRAVACGSAADCVAVVGGLATQYDGEGWSPLKLIGPSTGTPILSGVACVGGQRCWAVGYEEAGDPLRLGQLLLAERGGRWTTVAGPAVEGSELFGVTCLSPTSCWAVGAQVAADGHQSTLIELWDGVSWSVVPSPNVPVRQHAVQYSALATGELHSVTCVTADDCWAVGSTGQYLPASGSTLIEHWDGREWSIVPSAAKPLAYDVLVGVTCTASTSCWAVGGAEYRGVDTYSASGILEHWDGIRWVQWPLSASTGDPELLSVACRGRSACWAFGDTLTFGDIRTRGHVVTLRWQGSGWSRAPGPSGAVAGATCLPTSGCWAVGDRAWFSRS